MKSTPIICKKYHIRHFFIITALAIFLVACALPEFYSNDVKDNQSEDISENKELKYRNVKCPTIIIPKETYKYINANYKKKNKFNIKKADFLCQEGINETDNKQLLINFRVEIQSIANYEINYEKIRLPHIYLALIDKRNEKILTKVIAKTSSKGIYKSNKRNEIVNKGKFKIIHNNELSDLSIYIGFQLN